ncbi:MAG: hypothetical protein ABL891_12610 [Burkholderiales bacterium]
MPRYLVCACALFFSLLLAATPAHAVVERECMVALQAKSGWSAERKRTVRFMTGMELARITTTLNIELRQVYAVISHGTGLPTVARIDTVLLGVNREFTVADFVRLFEDGHARTATQIDGQGRTLTWRLRGRSPFY